MHDGMFRKRVLEETTQLETGAVSIDANANIHQGRPRNQLQRMQTELLPPKLKRCTQRASGIVFYDKRFDYHLFALQPGQTNCAALYQMLFRAV